MLYILDVTVVGCLQATRFCYLVNFLIHDSVAAVHEILTDSQPSSIPNGYILFKPFLIIDRTKHLDIVDSLNISKQTGFQT